MKIFKENKNDYCFSPSLRSYLKSLLEISIKEGIAEDVVFDNESGTNLRILLEVSQGEAEKIFVMDERDDNPNIINLNQALAKELSLDSYTDGVYMLATKARITYLERYSIKTCPYRVVTRRNK